MQRIILVFGLIAGAIVSMFMVIGISLMQQGLLTFDNGEIVGYAGMIIALSMIFFGIKSYRDNHLRRTITFMKAVQVGLLITLVASVLYAASWETYYQTNDEIRNSFMDRYTEHYVAKMKGKGASEADIEKAVAELNTMKEMYKNPVIRFGMTLLEILPVGILITLLSALVLRKKEILPA